MVRAKFRLVSYTTMITTSYKGGTSKEVESRTLKFQVVGGGTGSPENDRFFASTPSGQIELSTVSEAAWKMFELNKEYYLDFTPATPAEVVA